jgi:hypothetical protein
MQINTMVAMTAAFVLILASRSESDLLTMAAFSTTSAGQSIHAAATVSQILISA